MRVSLTCSTEAGVLTKGRGRAAWRQSTLGCRRMTWNLRPCLLHPLGSVTKSQLRPELLSLSFSPLSCITQTYTSDAKSSEDLLKAHTDSVHTHTHAALINFTKHFLSSRKYRNCCEFSVIALAVLSQGVISKVKVKGDHY